MALYVLLRGECVVNGKEKLIYLITHYKNGDYSTDDFCSLYTDTFNHKTEDSDFTDEEWEQYGEFMRITSRYSPYEEDFIKYPNAYNNTAAVTKALSKLCEYLHLP